ncbi:Nicotinate dehydrogenase FAD-subunit [Sulfitobacter sp. THAF37]|uniref:FAD binding domain-containing protein n=1 Tax=Sulfitobacter sp. THAF37 TaxID=2587855 RepID=UPI0012686465|nr:FAD binding domain-containing protein [Sulfitobacter sp. THAF37]QFT59948.1 Nicotinate dehydrogenase FAD-subunit [Sulfitobacter sp. THAF37]
MTDTAEYHRPDTLQGALDRLQEGGCRIAAGCTDLFAVNQHKTLSGPILDITGIPELRGIRRDADGLRIGAAATWTDVIRADLPCACAGLQLAAREVGARQIQNRGTVAGNICNASPAADGVPPLLTLDAVVEIAGADGTRRLPLCDFITGPRRTALAPGEIVTAVVIPEAALAGQGHFLKLGARHCLVISIAMTAARIVLRDGVVAQAALAVGSCGPVATRLPQVEAALIGASLDATRVTDADVAAALRPMDDMRATAGYRSIGAAELLRRTLAALQDLTEAA